MTTTEYSADVAYQAALDAISARDDDVQGGLAIERERAAEAASEYADWLAAGGDPTDYIDRDRERNSLGKYLYPALRAVFDLWNAQRERRSRTYPWGAGNWAIQEALLDSLGTPVPFADLKMVGSTWSRGHSADEVGRSAWAIQVATGGELRARKVKIGGKVAWLIREARDGDDLVDYKLREGYIGYLRDDAAARVDPLALGAFRSTVRDYPEETWPA